VFWGDGRHRCRDQQLDPFSVDSSPSGCLDLAVVSFGTGARPENTPRIRSPRAHSFSTTLIAKKAAYSPRFCKWSMVSSRVIQAVGSGRRGNRMITPTGGVAPTASPLAHYPDDTPHHEILPTPG
jgi:hypothetical protein